MVANLGHRDADMILMPRKANAAMQDAIERPGTREVYMHMRWHTQHPGEACPVCEAASNRDQQK
jgi:hypothetical protein